MGPDGHTASLFPHTAALDEKSPAGDGESCGNSERQLASDVDTPVINNASDVFFLIGGADKAQILKEVLLGPRDPKRLPSQLIAPASGILTLLLDKAAAVLLPAAGAEGDGTFERI